MRVQLSVFHMLKVVVFSLLLSLFFRIISPDSADEVPIPHFPHCTDLVSCYGDAGVPLSHPGVPCLSSSLSPPTVRPQPALQAGGRCLLAYGVNSDLLLLLLLLLRLPSPFL
jgi:hypothetical protein